MNRFSIHSRYWLIASVFTALAAFALRVYHLDQNGLWMDEIFTAIFAKPDNHLNDVIEHSLSTPIPTPPLFFIIMHGFRSMAGSSDFVIRYPAVLVGTLSVLLIARVGTLLFSK